MGMRLSFTKETTISNPCAILRALGVNDWETPLQPGNFVQSHRFGSYHEKGGGTVTRDWFVKIWREEIKQWKEKKGKLRENKLDKNENNLLGSLSTFQIPFLNQGVDELAKVFSGRTSPVNHRRTDAISTERKLESLLSRNNLVIARDVEWANVLFSFEQESRYMIMDASYPSAPVGFIRETSNVIFRQLLRTRRPFVAHVNDSHGNEIFQVRRPFWLINSSIYVEVDGKEIGVVHRRWHLWKRIYDLYLGNSQFAVVENPGFWNWNFTLKDEEGNVLAEIDRNWRGIGLELFTDAGQYVIRFGGSISGYNNGSEYHIEGLEVVRPLTLSERAVAVALAVSLDCDYFSRRGGWGLPIILLEE
ncbi:altered inheritance rate of mitochondria protein 25 [Carex littledalei]|uniref:Phospholipid scramblase n=1 Tax=Carex littledalei TaxID=544730 RepID=A0A833VN23_9POAL|nr:altered inheritance rate of mitochondria protein 25 [Carex littledalei]